MVLVSERAIAGRSALTPPHGIRVEGAAAAALAALQQLGDVEGPIVLVVTGRNIDDELWRRACDSSELVSGLSFTLLGLGNRDPARRGLTPSQRPHFDAIRAGGLRQATAQVSPEWRSAAEVAVTEPLRARLELVVDRLAVHRALDGPEDSDRRSVRSDAPKDERARRRGSGRPDGAS